MSIRVVYQQVTRYAYLAFLIHIPRFASWCPNSTIKALFQLSNEFIDSCCFGFNGRCLLLFHVLDTFDGKLDLAKTIISIILISMIIHPTIQSSSPLNYDQDLMKGPIARKSLDNQVRTRSIVMISKRTSDGESSLPCKSWGNHERIPLPWICHLFLVLQW